MWASTLIFSSTITGHVWIIPFFRIWGYMLHIECVSCVIMNCGQHLSVFPSALTIALYALPEKYSLFLAATKQLYEWFSLSVHPSVCLSVRHTFLTMFPSSYHHEIFRRYYQWQKWRPCKRSRSKVKVTEVTTQLNHFRTVTPVWIHIWWWNDRYSLTMLRRGAYCFSRSSVKFQGHTALKIVEFDPDWAFPDCNSSLNSPMATKCCTKLEVA